MATVTRRTAFPKVLIDRDSDSEQSSSKEETFEKEEEHADGIEFVDDLPILPQGTGVSQLKVVRSGWSFHDSKRRAISHASRL
ncbi:hypothetical protein Fmac_031376 [Flemingia macrophylla]|uniref:Uncharacterized protein n=1 Tax=Flemingia macrophylla TaxID=520843 RepID=A0ABD1L1W7_9FABA